MAKKQRVESGSLTGSIGAENLGIERPYGSAPNFPNKYCLYVDKGEGRIVNTFYTAYAARKFLDILLEDDSVAKIRGLTGQMDTIVSSTSIKVRCTYIDELIDYQYSAKEEQWGLGEPVRSAAIRFRASTHEYSAHEAANDDKGEPKVKREKVEKVPRPSKEGLITIQQICEELKMEPREARSILRKMEVVKPVPGWAWEKIKVDEIKTLLQNNK